ncbi:hypothetical protein B0H13DRAFT_2662276 [Mycena leptocephala]|nr:hypothetical protein B0H13DRAFT_2662276 [Mycena leptocephala]
MVHPSLPRIGNWADDGRWGNVNLSRLGIPEAIGQSGSISGRHDDEGDNPDKGGGDFDDYDGPTLTPGDDENPLHHDRSFSQPLLPDTDWEDLVDNPVGKKARFNNKENNEPEGVYKHKLNTFNREVREETGEKCSPGITAPKRKADSFKDDSAQAIKKRKLTSANPPSPAKSTASRRKILHGPVSDCYQKTSARKTSRIAESVENILSRNTGADQIFWTVASLVDTPRQWDDTDDDSALIPEADFIDHILLPYLTLCLISDDLQIDFLRAIKVLEESDAFGKGFNPVTRLQTARNTWCSVPPKVLLLQHLKSET